MGPRMLTIRLLGCLALLLFAYSLRGGTPRAREDKEWLITFCLVMIVFFAILHAMAYIPAAAFGSFSDMVSAARGNVSYAYENFTEVQWCAALMIILLLAWPIITFMILIKDGFAPYDELTEREMKLKGGSSASILQICRNVLHLYLCFSSLYLLIVMTVVYYMRNTSKHIGDNALLARRVSRWPYGAVFF